ncbi:prolyl oligopeptidase family serine peptidase [Streptomyces sp. NPDC021212]|uniref:prolyl oligopeptidase family serine peptidase n=1 Tax=Streptomyces sp. NPDC021212 TaxID=3365118 RepID=UPI0037B3A95D
MDDPYRWLEDEDSARTRAWLSGQHALLEDHFSGRRAEVAVWEDSVTEIEAAATGRPLSPNAEAGGLLFTHELTDQGGESVRVVETDGRSRVLLGIGDRSAVGRLAGWQPAPRGHVIVAQLHRDGRENGGLHLIPVAADRETRRIDDAAPHTTVAFTDSQLLYGAGTRTEHVLRAYRLADGTTRTVPSPVPGPARMSPYTGPGDQVLLRTRTPDGAPARWWYTAWKGHGTPDWQPLDLNGLPISAFALGTDALYVAVRGQGVRVLDLAAVARGRAAPPGPPAYETGNSVGDIKALRVLDSGPVPRLAILRQSGTTRRLDLLHTSRTETGPGPAAPGFGWHARLRLGPAAYDHDGRLAGAVWLLADDPRHGALSHRATSHTPSPAAARRSALRTLTATSPDGTTVPVTVCDPTPAAACRPVPTLVTVYGGFCVPLEPSWDPLFATWLAAGGRIAWVHTRGGGEFGPEWASAGRGPGKSAAVDDLCAAARLLLSDGEAHPGQLAGLAASNGGLVLAAAMTRAPNLFAAVTCAAPLTDMARYDQGGIGKLWREEYGDPTDPGALRSLLSYSPYHHVNEGVRYPATLLVTGGNDARVRPWHGWKLCAALRKATAADAPILLDHQENTGHYGRAGDDARTLSARVLYLLATRTGLSAPGGPRSPSDETPLRSSA